MLKFWKKTGRKEFSGSSSSSASSTSRNHPSPTYNGVGFFPGNLATQIKELQSQLQKDAEIKSSCLSKTLVEIINDNEALTYFIQYLETIGCGAMIKFILDVESFNSALLISDETKLRSNTNECINVSEHHKNDALDVLLFKKNKKMFLNRNSEFSQSFLLNSNNIDGNGCEGNTITNSTNLTEKNNIEVKKRMSSIEEKNDAESINCDCADGSNGDDGVNAVNDANKESESDNSCNKLDENEVISSLLQSSENSDSVADAIKIFKKYFSHKAPLKINLNSDVHKKLIKNLKSDSIKDSFLEVKEYILKIIEKEHFNDYLRSECHCKYQIDILTSKKVCITDILFNETALFYFMEFLEQENCTNYLEFWISAHNFQQQYEKQGENYDAAQAQSDAMVLYDKYFSLQATSPLYLGDDIRIKVEESICSEQGPLPNCFEYPRRLILKLLEINYFQSFLQSQLYFKYLSELISTIQTSPLLGHRSRISGDSDCSSDISVSATNTLLASEDINPSKKLYKHINSSSLSIDTQQLYNPDSLWQRGTKKSGLNFGRINALGRFETDLEPEPDKKEESRITRAVKKLVNLNEDKSKEEMAWRVAAMIVRDVTNVTMPSSSES